MIRNLFTYISLLITPLIFFFCAGQYPPSGGPQDKEPPEIIYSYPAIGTLNHLDRKYVLQFNEYVDRRSVEQSIFVSPSVGELIFDWSGTEVEITFSDSLRNNTTYVLTVGTDVVDTRNHNRMAKAFTLPFSTGDVIDSASISGKIFASDPDGIMIYAYQLDNRDKDTIDPRYLKPDYLTQTGKDGSFTLSHLANGNYRLIAMEDEFRNLLYDFQTDKYGVLNTDITLTDAEPNINGIQFLLTSEDTTKPFLSKAQALDRTHVLIRFSEPIDTSSFQYDNVIINDTITKQPILIKDFALIGSTNTEVQIITYPLDSASNYFITVNEVKDYEGNIIDSDANRVIFSGTDLIDTTKPYILSINSRDSLTKIMIDDTLTFQLSEAVIKSKFENGFYFFDSLENSISGKFIWWNSAYVSFIPVKPLLWNSKYSINIKLDSVEDYSGNHFTDTIASYNFFTYDERMFGKIEGQILDVNTNSKGKIILEIKEVSKKDIKSQHITIDEPGPFKIDRLLEGKYTIFSFRDDDNNKAYTYGKAVPFLPSERFNVYPDTIKVRARWPLEGVKISFK